jgi:serine-type D-Ala-D-Ala carboxypeptidase (penicillin-binding protein 5/6)
MKRIAIVLAVWVVVLAGIVVAAELKPLPAPLVTLKVAPTVALDSSTPPAIPIPYRGSFALETLQDGELASHDADTTEPTASVAKTMTALAILDARPLSGTAPGPTLTVSASDVSLYHQIVAEGGSFAPVTLGETLTERDLLLGMMLPSANNFAVMAANWIDGSQPVFVGRLNQMAKTMGMSHTVFVDPDGLSSQTVSTPNDLLKLGVAAIDNPTLAAIVTMSKATLPDGSVVTNIDAPLLSTPGWLGIKTGHTPAAGYCLLFAAQGLVGTGLPHVTVVGAVMGQATRADTFSVAIAGVRSALAGYVAVDLAHVHPAVTGRVTAPWGSASGLVTTAGSQVVDVRRGVDIPLLLSAVPLSGCDSAGCVVGRVTGRFNGAPLAWNVVTTSPIGPPNPWQRLTGLWWLRGH